MKQPKNEILFMLLSAAIMLMLVISFYLLFQNNTVYHHTLGKITGNYHNDNGQITKGKIPYEKFSPTKMYSWDANLYRQIRDNGYDIPSAGGDYIFAFFPLFPYTWKLSGLSALQISFINYLLWTISLIILLTLIPNKDNLSKWKYFLVLVGIPMLVVFLIPYSEGLYMITITVALWGLYKNKYGWYFISALLSAMTRSSVSVLLLAIFFTEVYFFLQHHKFTLTAKSFVFKIIPLLIGTLFVTFIQYQHGSNHIAKFIEVEKYWGYGLRMPKNITDWAQEQFCTNLPLILFVLPVIIAFLVFNVKKFILSKKDSIHAKIQKPPDYNREYLYVLSLMYIAGMILTILLLRGGSLNGLSRYVFCTPFYIVALFMMKEKTSYIDLRVKIAVLSVVLLLAILTFSLVNYSKSWNFSDLGFFIFYSQITFFSLDTLFHRKWLIAGFTLLSALWASYLFNMFISNAWIIT